MLSTEKNLVMATEEMVACIPKEALKSFTTYRTDSLSFVALWMQSHYGIKKQMNRESMLIMCNVHFFRTLGATSKNGCYRKRKVP